MPPLFEGAVGHSCICRDLWLSDFSLGILVSAVLCWIFLELLTRECFFREESSSVVSYRLSTKFLRLGTFTSFLTAWNREICWYYINGIAVSIIQLEEGLKNGNVTHCSNRDKNFNKKSSQGMLDIFVLDFEEIMCTFLWRSKRVGTRRKNRLKCAHKCI